MKEQKQKKGCLGRIIRWLIYGFVLPLVLLYAVIFFVRPEERYLPKVIEKIQKETGILLEYQSISISPWFHLVFEKLKIAQDPEHVYSMGRNSIKLEAKTLFSADVLDIGIAYRALLSGNAGLSFDIMAYGGSIIGSAVAPITNPNAPLHLLPHWENIQLDRLVVDFPDIPLNQGITSGHADIVLIPEKIFGMSGPVEFTADQINYALDTQLSGASDIKTIRKVSGKLLLNEEKVELIEIKGTGDVASFRVDGMIIQNILPEKSQLNLNVRLYSSNQGAENDEKNFIPLTITGLAENPIVNFMGLKFDSSGLSQ